MGVQVIDQGLHGGGVVLEIGGMRVQLGVQNGHGASLACAAGLGFGRIECAMPVSLKVTVLFGGVKWVANCVTICAIMKGTISIFFNLGHLLANYFVMAVCVEIPMAFVCVIASAFMLCGLDPLFVLQVAQIALDLLYQSDACIIAL